MIKISKVKPFFLFQLKPKLLRTSRGMNSVPRLTTLFSPPISNLTVTVLYCVGGSTSSYILSNKISLDETVCIEILVGCELGQEKGYEFQNFFVK